MISGIQITKQRGVALVLSLLLLFVLITLGVAGFGNTHLQERSASNARLQAEAFKAASAGAANAINFFVENRDRDDIGIRDTLCGASNHTGWYDPDDPTVALPTAWVKPSEWPDNPADSDLIGKAELRQRMYCLADTYPCGAEDEALGFDCSEVGRPPRSQMFVVSRGEVKVDNKVVAQRDIEVRIARGIDGDPGDGCGALCFPGCDINEAESEFPNSHKFAVDGEGGYAITVGCESGRESILDEITQHNIGNYQGGIGQSGGGEPWTEDGIGPFRDGVKTEAQLMASEGCENCYFADGLNVSGDQTFGSLETPQITFIEGDANIGGSISGAGILFVTGDLLMNGTPQYQGLIVVLGGVWEIDGGGAGGNPGKKDKIDPTNSGGSIVVLNVQEDGTFGDIIFDNPGGGNAIYRYDCDTLKRMRSELLPEELQAMWNPQCTAAPGLFILGPERIIIASWRENIGWREELFAD